MVGYNSCEERNDRIQREERKEKEKRGQVLEQKKRVVALTSPPTDGRTSVGGRGKRDQKGTGTVVTMAKNTRLRRSRETTIIRRCRRGTARTDHSKQKGVNFFSPCGRYYPRSSLSQNTKWNIQRTHHCGIPLSALVFVCS